MTALEFSSFVMFPVESVEWGKNNLVLLKAEHILPDSMHITGHYLDRCESLYAESVYPSTVFP